MYFDNFPKNFYQFPDGVVRNYTNLTIRPGVVEKFFGSASNLQTYTVRDGETPEVIAYNAFNDAKLHWVIMLINKINSVYTDWPMNTDQLQDYLWEKYRVQKDSDGNSVTLTDEEVSEFVEFTGAPSNGYNEFFDNGVEKRPHHFVDANGVEYSFDSAVGGTVDAFNRVVVFPELTPVSIYAYEEQLNEAKRIILLPKASFVEQFKQELRKTLNE